MKKRIFLLVFFSIFSIFCNVNGTFAVQDLELTESYTIADFDFNPDRWDPTPAVENATIPSLVSERVGKITGFIRNIGIVLSVIGLMIIGIRELFGSIEDKSSYRESLPGYIIGIIMVLSMTTIPDIIYKIMK